MTFFDKKNLLIDGYSRNNTRNKKYITKDLVKIIIDYFVSNETERAIELRINKLVNNSVRTNIYYSIFVDKIFVRLEVVIKKITNRYDIGLFYKITDFDKFQFIGFENAPDEITRYIFDYYEVFSHNSREEMQLRTYSNNFNDSFF